MITVFYIITVLDDYRPHKRPHINRIVSMCDKFNM